MADGSPASGETSRLSADQDKNEASVHHHHYHDRSVHVHGNVGNVATGDGHSGDMSATISDSHQQEKQQEEIAKELEEWTSGMVETAAFKKVMEMLNNGLTWITIKGSPGEGKTTVAKMALRELQKSGRQVFQARSPEQFTAITKVYTQPVVMLDDILGQVEFDQADWLRWRPIFHQVLDVKEHRSNEQKSLTSDKREITVLLIGRDYVLNSASVPMGRLFDFITQTSRVVNMSHSVRRHLEEKGKIWDAIVGPSGIKVPPDSLYYIFNLEGQHGFPHVCRLFVTAHKENPDVSPESFFKTPLDFLNETMRMFLEDESKLILFKEMISRQGKVSERDLQQTNHKVVKTAKQLIGTYLRMDHGYFVFDHPSIYDSVAFNLCNYHTLFVIKNCKLSFIHERLRLESSQDNRRRKYTDSDLVMYISEHFIEDFADRFAVEISNRNLLMVLSHQVWTQAMFIKEVMSRLTLPLVELINMTDSDSDETFLSLVASNRSPLLLKYIDDHTDTQLTESDINTVLYGVCKYAASDVLSYLKQTRHTLDINVKYGNELTPLMIATETRNGQFVQQILSLNPDLGAHDRYRKTVLHHMCRNGLASAVRQAVDKGTSINVKDRIGWSPLVYAVRGCHLNVMQVLLDQGATVDGNAAALACNIGDIQTVAILFDKGASVNMVSPLYGMPLSTACTHSHTEVIRYLIEKGASVNTPHEHVFPLHLAEKPEAVQFLIENGAIVDSRDDTGETPLHRAVQRGSKERTDMLLKAGANVNLQCDYGNAPLHVAASWNSKHCVDLLLKAGADINVKDKSKYTPLHKAAERRFKECVDVLVLAGADVNVKNFYGRTALHTAVYFQREDPAPKLLLPDISICQTLIRHGADVHTKDNEGDTPLHLLCRVDSESTPIYTVWITTRAIGQPASIYEHVYRKLVTLLIDHGADVNSLNDLKDPALRGWCQTLVKFRNLE